MLIKYETQYPKNGIYQAPNTNGIMDAVDIHITKYFDTDLYSVSAKSESMKKYIPITIGYSKEDADRIMNNIIKHFSDNSSNNVLDINNVVNEVLNLKQEIK